MEVSKTYEHNFFFLGDRKYVHASNLTYGLIEAVNSWSLGEIDRLVASYHFMLTEHGRYDLLDHCKSESLIQRGYCAFFNIQCQKNFYLVGLKGTGEAVADSIPYDENSLIASHKIFHDSKSAYLVYYHGKPILNILIALNKKLHLTVFPTDNYANWIVSKLDLEWNILRSIDKTTLLITVIGNIALLNTKSEVTLGDQKLGYIYFSRGALS